MPKVSPTITSRRHIDDELSLLRAAPQMQCATSVPRCEALLADHHSALTTDEMLYVLRVGASGCQAAGRWLEGLQWARRGVNIASTQRKHADKIPFLAITGNIHSFLGNIHLAIRAMHEAMVIAEHEKLVEDQVKLMLGLGPMYARLDLHEQALSAYQRGNEIAIASGFMSLSIGAQNNIAQTYCRMGQLDLAMLNVRASLRLAEEHADSRWLPYILHTNAEILATQGNVLDAIAEADKASEMLRQSGNVPILLRVLLDSATWLMELGQIDAARARLTDAALLPQERSIHELREALALAWIKLERQSKHPASALKAFDDFLAARADGKKISLESQRIATEFVEDVNRSEARGRRESAAVNDLTMRLIETQAEAQRIARQGARDPLTGALNRAAFEAALARAASAPHAQPVALIMLDIDNFRDVNAKDGHPVGDAVLKAVVDRIRQALRTNDLLCRYGGDEFLVMCPSVGPRTAATITKRVLARISSEPISFDGRSIHLSASMGVACTQSPRLATLPYLVKRADAALRRAKLAGKNRAMIVRLTT
jgi:diguanylate cyclase